MEITTEDKLVLIAKHAKDSRVKFTSLTHLLNAKYLKNCYQLLKKRKAFGVDGRTKESYTEAEIDQKLSEAAQMIRTKRYHPQPVRRVYVDKPNGDKRPLGIPTVIDKTVQLGATRIMEAIYEETFLPQSYGFRRSISPHDCLTEVNHMIMGKKTNWIVEADIKGFFDNIVHNWLMKCLSERISDPNFKLMVYRFLKAGIEEDGKRIKAKQGTPQGGNLSPILGNIYLHYVLDLWFDKVLKRKIKGFCQLVRYADDFIIGVQHRKEAEIILDELQRRLNKFGLTLSEDKTGTVEFGRFAEENSKRKGKGKPKTFNFLGFTHYCSKTRDGRFAVKLKTAKGRYQRSMVFLNSWLKKVRNQMPLRNIWQILALKLQGHYNYYGVSGNFESIKSFYQQSRRIIFKWMNRRSQKKSWNWKGFERYLSTYPLPKPKLTYAFYNTW